MVSRETSLPEGSVGRLLRDLHDNVAWCHEVIRASENGLFIDRHQIAAMHGYLDKALWWAFELGARLEAEGYDCGTQ